MCESLLKIRQVTTPKNPSINSSIAAPDPFAEPKSVVNTEAVFSEAINGSNTPSISAHPAAYPSGMVKNCSVFLAE